MSIVCETNDEVKCEEFAEVIKIDEGKVRQHVEEVVRQSVEETLNGLLDAEADELCGAKRYKRSVERLDTRSGHYRRKLHTKAGEVTLNVPRLRSLPFETQIIERRGGVGGDVSGGRVAASGGGHHRGIVGHAGQRERRQ